MKKLFAAIFLCLLFTSVPAHADNDVVMKISMNGTVKGAKDIASGKGISFVLPELTDNKFIISAIELAVFERRENETQWHIYKNESGIESKKKLIQNPAGLSFQMDFGKDEDYRENAKYKIAYRYYVTVLEDGSKTIIAGSDVKDGWRMVGEPAPTAATNSGFSFYKNAVPTLSVTGISFQAETINGIQTRSYSTTQLGSAWLPSDVLQKGLTVDYTVSDFDNEDSLTVGYQLIDISSALHLHPFVTSSKTLCIAEY